MKRALLLILIACAALLAVWRFSTQRQPRNPDSEYSAAIAPSTAGQIDRKQASRPVPAAGEPESATGTWQRILSWVGISSRPEAVPAITNAVAGSRAVNRVDIGEKALSLRQGGELGAHSQAPDSISGRVLDDAGQPVAGMEISAFSIRIARELGGASERKPAASTSSDIAGAYRFEQLAEGEYRIRTSATDLYLPAEIVARTGLHSADLVVSGERYLTIQGSVKDIQGKLLEGARVTYMQTPSFNASTDQDGGYRLQIPVTRSTRGCVLKFQSAGYREESRQLSATQISGLSAIRLDASLTPVKQLAVVGGIVTNRQGEPLRNETVTLMGLSRYEAVTDQAGEFVMAKVEAGQSYRIRIAGHPPYRPYVAQVRVGPEGLYQEVVMETGGPESASLSGRMMDAVGNPLPRFTMWLQSNNPAARGPMQFTTDEMGRFSISEVPLGSLVLSTRSHPRFQVSGINMPEGGTDNLDLILDWGGYAVAGQVLDPVGTPVAGSKIVLSWFFQNGGIRSVSERETVSDAEGQFRFGQVGPGTHSIRVSLPGFQTARVGYNVGTDSGGVVVRLERNSQTLLVKE